MKTNNRNHTAPAIPKIIHQIWSGIEDELPPFFKTLSETWIKNHPDWTYELWDQQKMTRFINDYYPDLKETYESFPYHIQRWDAIRYLILDQTGGMYVDFDYESLRPVAPILQEKTCCFSMEPEKHCQHFGNKTFFNNALMASVPGHPFIKAIIEQVFYKNQTEAGTYENKNMEVLSTTGPHMLYKVYQEYTDKEKVWLIPAELVSPFSKGEARDYFSGKLEEQIRKRSEQAYAIHYFAGKWVTTETPSLSLPETKEIVKKELTDIAEQMYRWITSGPEESGIGAYSGDFGVLLFLYYYAHYSGDEKFLTLTEDYTAQVLESLNKKPVNHTFCTGISGILYICLLLKEKEWADIDFGEAETTLEDFIRNGARRNMENRYYDFMHGALGPGLWFLKKNAETDFIHELIDYLNHTAEKEEPDIYKWTSVLGITQETGYNISLSHGLSGIILFLCRVLRNGIQHAQTIPLLTGAVNYILSQKLEVEKQGSFFPNQSKANRARSRLAWCTGDLGVGYALWQAGQVTHTPVWEETGYEVLLRTTQRLDPQKEFMNEASICHGSAGVALFFRHLFIQTREECFKKAADRWIQQTLPLLKTDRKIINNFSLLMGITGIGFTFLSWLNEDEQEWDELFLL